MKVIAEAILHNKWYCFVYYNWVSMSEPHLIVLMCEPTLSMVEWCRSVSPYRKSHSWNIKQNIWKLQWCHTSTVLALDQWMAHSAMAHERATKTRKKGWKVMLTGQSVQAKLDQPVPHIMYVSYNYCHLVNTQQLWHLSSVAEMHAAG